VNHPTSGTAYEAAFSSVAVLDRSTRGRFEVAGRAPVRMLDGILTASVPPGPVQSGPDVLRGRAAYSAVLTPKGRMVTDLRVLCTDAEAASGEAGALPPDTAGGAAERLILDVPPQGRESLLAHLGRFLPPRLAKVEDVSAGTGLVTVLGPDAAGLLSREALGLRVESGALRGMDEHDYVVVGKGGGEGVTVLRTADVATPAFDVIGERATIRALRDRLVEVGAVEADQTTWETLRVEAGRPAFGSDMDEETIPVEAGIHLRAIDYEKGCYTGQEVIVRIRDRGHVNRHLRGFRFGNRSPPPRGTELFALTRRGDAPVGMVTSAVRSPRAGETMGLGYVRREIEPGQKVRVGDPDGAEAIVATLEAGWAPTG
jgi:folate-binding protein YgfZ